MDIDLKAEVTKLGADVIKWKDFTANEEQTKMSLIVPFLKMLGYNPSNPMEVVSEFTADVGLKKGEKVDYAILKENEPILLVECKHWKDNLNRHSGQLFRYFAVTKAKFGLLTNGVEYLFYTDLDEPNKMDEKPFFSFDITKIRDNQVKELEKFHKTSFNVETLSASAEDLKYSELIKETFKKELISPSEEFPSVGFVRFIMDQVYNGKRTEKWVQYFTKLVKKSFQQFLTEYHTDKLKEYTSSEEKKNASEEIKFAVESQSEKNKIVTTEEEIQAYYIVRAILGKKVSVGRIALRDAQNYCAVFFDDNNRNPICRFWFNNLDRKQIEIFDQNKEKTTYDINSLDDIYRYADALEKVVEFYDKKESS